MSASEVLIVRTGTANVASVVAALRRLGASPRLSAAAEDVRSARALVLPGVGAFGAAMHELAQAGLVEPLKARLAAGQATLAICLGLQVLAGSSEESPGSRGLSFLESAVTRIAGEVRIPHIGWNRVGVSAGAGARDAVVRDGYAYYANSFALPSREAAAPLVAAGWRVAETSHGSAFVAAIERGGIVACQFHPELSGAWGLGLMRRWLERAGVTLACAEGVTC